MQNDTQSFIVRMWHELTDSEGNIISWRGSIDHVGSGKRLYFHDLYGIVRFIQDQLGLTTISTPWWKSLLVRIKHKALEIKGD